MGNTYKNAVLAAFGALDSVAQQTKKVFYVLRRGMDGRPAYLGTPLRYPMGPWRDHLSAATQFASVDAALAHATDPRNEFGAVRGANGTHIVRVEEIITVGSKSRVEVPLGDTRQTGVVIHHNGCRPNYVAGLENGSPRANWWAGLEGATVYRSQSEAWLAFQKYIQGSKGVVLAEPPSFVGIAEESIPGTTTYNETVLA